MIHVLRSIFHSILRSYFVIGILALPRTSASSGERELLDGREEVPDVNGGLDRDLVSTWDVRLIVLVASTGHLTPTGGSPFVGGR